VTTPRIDSHQHFWQLARGDYTWLRADVPALAPLCRDFLPADLAPALQAHGVQQTVLVQAAATEQETEFMLALADPHDFIGGVVGWIDLSRAGTEHTLERWARHPKFKGVRPMLQDLPEADWIARAPRPEGVRALVSLGLRFDALVQPHHLEALLSFVHAHPELPVVIDHAAKPQLGQGWAGEWAGPWRTHMAALAACPQVMCKFSGLLTESPPHADAHTLRPVWDSLLQWFGPQRLMWGSDWPVLTLAADYAGWVATSQALIGELSATEQAHVWQRSAARFYGLAA
jgi:L-fuconolactonase